MNDRNRTKEQLIDELEALRAEVASLRNLRTSRISTNSDLHSLLEPLANCDRTDDDCAHEQLRQLSERLKLAIESAQIGIWEWDIVHNQLIWDERMRELYGVAPSDFLGAYPAWEQGVHPEDRARANAAIQQALKGEKEFNCEFRILLPDGTMRTVRAHAIVQRNPQGEPQRMIGVNFDISEAKQREAERYQVEKALELQAVITRNMAEGICLVRVDNAVIVYANPKFERMFGYDPGELKDQHVAIVNYVDGSVTAEDVNQAIRAEVLESGEHTYEVHNIKKDGTPFWCSATTSVFHHPDYGDVLVAVHQDITACKQAEAQLERLNRDLEQRITQRTEELTQTNARLQEELVQRERLQRELVQREQLLNGFFNAASAANIGLCIHDRNLSYLQINQTLADIHGLPIAAHLGKTCSEIIPNIATTLIPALESVIDTGQAIDKLEVSGTMPSQPDSLRYWLVSFFPIFGETEQVSAVGKIVVEITERKRIEEALRKSEEQLRLALDVTHIGFWDLDLLTQQTTWNDNHFTLLGLEPNAIESSVQAWEERIHPEDRDWVERQFSRSLETDSNYEAEYRVIYPDGSVHWLLGRGNTVYDASGQPVRSIGLVLDINDLKLAEETIKRSEEKYRQIVDTTNEGIWVVDAQGKTRFINPQIVKMFGYSLEEMLDRSLFTFIDDGEQAIASVKMEAHRQGIAEQYDFKFRRQNGSDLWCQISTNPIFDEAGEFVGALRMLTDISDRKQSEEAMQSFNQQLEIRIEELRQKNQEMHLIGEISNFLQSCLTVEEACATITTLAKPLFPDCAVGIFMIANSRNRLELVNFWGNLAFTGSLFHTHHCWALRRGRSHWISSDQHELLCEHTDPNHPPTESLCIPMIAQGETLGLLHLSASRSGCLTESRQQLARTVAEQLSLAIANLTLRATLQAQSIRDPLTGLFNRRYLEEFLPQEIHRAKRNHYPVGVIMIDLDHFKKFNDTLGHDGGDFILKEVGQLLKDAIRPSDIACRFGGEEMILILPETPMEIACERAESVREAIAQLRLSYNSVLIESVTASLGVACFPNQGITASAIIQKADAALYCAKAAGRNQVVGADRTPCSENTPECLERGQNESARFSP